MSHSFLESMAANTAVSIARRVKRRLPDIEAALADGYTHREILAQLNREGIELTEKYYRRLIPRLRNQVKAHHADAAPQQPQQERVQSTYPSSEKHATPRVRANRSDLPAGITENSAGPPSMISQPSPEPIPFTWDPHAAKNYSIDKL
jgi:hypothetical protein